MGSLETQEFMELLIAELQNQDPLAPTETSEMLKQISLISEIDSTNRLTDTLSALMTNQNLSTASGMIGKSIRAIGADGAPVEGVVDRVSIEIDEEDEDKRTLYVHIGDNAVEMNDVREVRDATEQTTE
jgi:flagellar basal-body rod modification protein FlgD